MRTRYLILALVLTLFAGTVSALDINSTKALQYHGGSAPADLDFQVGTGGTVSAYGDVDVQSNKALFDDGSGAEYQIWDESGTFSIQTANGDDGLRIESGKKVIIPNNNLDLTDNNVTDVSNIYQDDSQTNFFDSCSGSDVVTGINSDGSVSCTSTSSGTDDQNLQYSIPGSEPLSTYEDQEIGIENGQNITFRDYYEADTTIPDDQRLDEVLSEGRYTDGTSILVNGSSQVEGDSGQDIDFSGSDIQLRDTGGTDILRAKDNNNLVLPNGNLNLSKNQIQDASRIEFDGSDPGYIEELGGGAMTINSQGNKLRLQSDNSNDISMESEVDMNSNQFKNMANLPMSGSNITNVRKVQREYSRTLYDADNGEFGSNNMISISRNSNIISVDDNENGVGAFRVVKGFNNKGDTSYTKLLEAKNDGTVRVPSGDFNISRANSDGDVISMLQNTGTGDSDVDLELHSSDQGESRIEFYRNGGGASIDLQVGDASNDNLEILDDSDNTIAEFDSSNQNVTIPTGDFHVGGQLSAGSTECSAGEFIDGDGSCTSPAESSDDQKLYEVLNQGDFTGSNNIVVNETQSLDFNGNITIGDSSSSVNAPNSLLVGKGASVSGTESVAIGDNSAANRRSVGIGYSVNPNKRDTTAVGWDAIANSVEATALGSEAQATGDTAVALGPEAIASADGAVAIGYEGRAPNTHEVTLGNLDNDQYDLNVTGNLTVHGEDGILMSDGVIIGNSATSSNGGGAVAISSSADASGTDAIAIGQSAESANSETVAIGVNSYAGGAGGIALGRQAENSDDYTATFGRMNPTESYQKRYNVKVSGNTTIAGSDGLSLTRGDLTISRGTSGGAPEVTSTIQNTGTGDADAVQYIRSSADGESDIRWYHDSSQVFKMTTGAATSNNMKFFDGNGDQFVRFETSSNDVEITDGDLNLTQGTLKGVGATQCNDGEFIDGAGDCESPSSSSDDQTLSTSGDKISIENANSVYAPFANNSDQLDGVELSNINWGDTAMAQSDVDFADLGESTVDLDLGNKAIDDVVEVRRVSDAPLHVASRVDDVQLEPNDNTALKAKARGEVEINRGPLNLTDESNPNLNIIQADPTIDIKESNEADKQGVRFYLDDGVFEMRRTTESTAFGSKIMELNVSNQNVDIPNGDLNISGQLSAGSTQCADGEFIDGQGDCETPGSSSDDQTLSEVLSQGNDADRSIDFNDQSQVVIGGSNSVNNESLVIGKGARADGAFDSGDNKWRNETAVGTLASATGAQGVALGYNSDSSGEDSTSLGTRSQSTALESVAVGTEAYSSAQEATSIGAYTDARVIGTVALGYDADASTDRDAISIGSRSTASGVGSVAIGGDSDEDDSAADTSANNAVALGADATVSGAGGVAIGEGTTANNADDTSIGENAGGGVGSGETSVGVGAQASGFASTALGRGAETSASHAVAIGDQARAPNANEATFGNLNGQELDVNVTGNMTVHGGGEHVMYGSLLIDESPDSGGDSLSIDTSNNGGGNTVLDSGGNRVEFQTDGNTFFQGSASGGTQFFRVGTGMVSPDEFTMVDYNLDGSDSAGTPEGYNLSVNENTLMRYYTESDGSGGMQNSEIRIPNSGLNVRDGSTDIADFQTSGITLNQPVSIEAPGPLSASNGIDLTDSSSNTIDSHSTMYLQTSSGAPSDIVMDPSGDTGVKSNLSVSGGISQGKGFWSSHLSTRTGDVDGGLDIPVMQNIDVSDSFFTKQDNQDLAINRSGLYRVDYTVVFERDTGSGREILSTVLRRNDVNMNSRTYAECYLRNSANGDSCSTSTSNLVEFDKGDEIELRANDAESNGDSTDVETAYITLEYKR